MGQAAFPAEEAEEEAEEAVGQVNKVLRFVLLAVCLLKISSIFSLYFNDFTAVKEDSWRDYLIGRHVTYYGESPGTGPYTSLLNSRFTSPFYYYIVALIVKVWDDIRSLFLVNIFLQVVSVLLSYLIAGKLFNEKVALTTLVLVVFGVRNMEIMAAYWHAWVNIPLILLSFYLLAAVKKTKKNVVLLSSVILSVASIIHMSGYIFLVIAYGFLFFKKREYFYHAFILSVGVLLLFYLPLFSSFQKAGAGLGSINFSALNGFSGFYRYSGAFYYLAPVFLAGFALTDRKNILLRICAFSLIIFLNLGGSFSKIFHFSFSQNYIISNTGKVIAEDAGRRGFALLTYKNGVGNNLYQARILVEVEKITGKKLIVINDSVVENFSVIDPDTSTLYLVCQQAECVDPAKEFTEGYDSSMLIYSSPFEKVYKFN